MTQEQPVDVHGMLDNVLKTLRSEPRTVRRIRVECGETAIELEWDQPGGGPRDDSSTTARLAAPPPVGAEAPVEEPDDDANHHFVTAPMVGTFYRGPAPGEAPFVRDGDLVEAGQQVGILEAMKLMNPVEADCAGRVEEILVADATPVEYDQRLMVLVPADGA